MKPLGILAAVLGLGVLLFVLLGDDGGRGAGRTSRTSVEGRREPSAPPRTPTEAADTTQRPQATSTERPQDPAPPSRRIETRPSAAPTRPAATVRRQLLGTAVGPEGPLRGADVHLHRYRGGHEFEPWSAELIDALRWLTKATG